MKWHPNDKLQWLSESAKQSLEMWVVIFIICTLGAAVLACFWCGGMAYARGQ